MRTFVATTFVEPAQLDPIRVSGASSSYLFFNLFRSLFKYENKLGVVPEIAKKCEWDKSEIKLTCFLDPSKKWSDGKVITALDFVTSFRRLIDPESKSRDTGLLLNLRNASEILKGEKKPDELGVEAKDEQTLIFSLKRKDAEFLAKLASPILVPFRKTVIPGKQETYISAGPFVVSEWKKGRSVKLLPNPYWKTTDISLEILFLEEATTAMNLYELGKLDFVPELPVHLVETYKNKKDYFTTDFARFDYIGFGEDLKEFPKLREALALSANYEEVLKIFNSTSRPGCPSLPDSFLGKRRCYEFNLTRAKKIFNELPEEVRKKSWKLYFTNIASNSLQIIAEWYQAQWKKNLGIEIELHSQEFGMYRQNLRTKPPSLFRVGVTLDRPTCLAALENFESTSGDNYIRLNSPEYDKIVLDLSQTKNSKKLQLLCKRGVDYLMDRHLLIPQGQFYFSRLLRPAFTGAKFNILGQIDFSGLKLSK